MPALDLRSAARDVIPIVSAVRADQMGDPTPCPDYSVAALLDHFMALTSTFTVAARKGDRAELAGESPAGHATAAHLDPDWRTVLPERLEALARAWADPGAWQGDTEAGVPLPAELAGVVALDEVVLHGWDLARATGQNYVPDPADVEAVLSFTEQTSKPEQAQLRAAIFGPIIEVAASASSWHRALGLAGRDPAWVPGGS